MDHTDHNADDTTNMTSHQVSTTEPVIASSSSEKTTINLRELEISDRFFWKDSLIEQLSQNIEDKGTDGNPRKLLGNEITVMAFNEIALRRGRGFLFHLKERGCWQSHSKEELYPSSRDQPRPGAAFPSVVYMDYVWTPEEILTVLRRGHRARYLNCDGLLNPPMDHAPLYALQYIGHSKCTPFNTLKDSLIVIVTSSTIHLVSTSEWKEVVGLKTPKGKGEEALKFNTTSFLWPSKSAKSLKKKKTQEPEIRNKMRPFEVDNMEALYDKIVERCRFGNMPSTFTADGLRQTLSRPSSPAPGIALGTPLTFDEKRHGMVLESANPPSRRGGHLQRGRVSQARGRAESGVALGTNEEQQDLVPESSNPPRRGGRLQRGRVS